MDSAMYDQVSRLSIDGRSGGAGRFRKGVRAVIAHQRLDTQIYGRRWNDLTPEGQRHIIDERRERRMREAEERRAMEARRVSYDDLTTTLRRNSVLSAASLSSSRRMSSQGLSTDLRRMSSNLVWTKAWHLSDEASKPFLDSGAKFHNRRNSSFVAKEQLLSIGVVYIKMPSLTADLTAMNELCLERGYCMSHQEELNPTHTGRITKWYMEHYYTTESILYVAKGSCYVDVRDEHGDFVRIHLAEGDLVVIPAGLYHRGALDQSENLKLMQLFQDEKFEECFRDDAGAQQHEARASYLTSLKRRSVCEDNAFICG